MSDDLPPFVAAALARRLLPKIDYGDGLITIAGDD
jgi:hypothetical protein